MPTNHNDLAYDVLRLVGGTLLAFEEIRGSLGPEERRDTPSADFEERSAVVLKDLWDLTTLRGEVIARLSSDVLASVRRCNSEPIRLWDASTPYASNLEAGIALAGMAIALVPAGASEVHKLARMIGEERGRELYARSEQEFAHLGVGDGLVYWPATPHPEEQLETNDLSDGATHSIDFASVYWYGTQFVFTKNQAEVLQVARTVHSLISGQPVDSRTPPG